MEEKTKIDKGKGKEMVGEGKGLCPVPPKEREQQPEAGPSQIRPTSLLPKKKAKMVLQASSANNVPQSGAAGVETMVPSGAGGAESSRAERSRAMPPKPPVPQLWTSKFYAVMQPAKSSKAPRMHGVPMDEMVRLSVGERQEGAREGARHSHRWLGSLEEMDIDHQENAF